MTLNSAGVTVYHGKVKLKYYDEKGILASSTA